MLGLKDARTQVHKYKSELDQGRDPVQLKLKGGSDYLKQLTVKEISEFWFKTIAVNKIATKDGQRAFELHLYPQVKDSVMM